MSRVWYVFFLIIIAFVAVILMFVMFNDHSQQHLHAIDLQQAVSRALQNNRDDSSRLEKGIYVENTKGFQTEISGVHIPHFPHAHFFCRFIPIKTQGNGVKTNDSKLSYEAQQYINNRHDSGVYPIEGVQVIAVPDKVYKEKGNNDNDVRNDLENHPDRIPLSKRFVTTMIIQNNDKDTKYPSDYGNTKRDKGYPARQGSQSSSNTADLTDNSF